MKEYLMGVAIGIMVLNLLYVNIVLWERMKKDER